RNWARLWSMRKDGRRVATLCVAQRRYDPLLNVFEVRAAGNADAPAEVSWAARQWLHGHDLRHLQVNSPSRHAPPPDRAAWLSLWRPYWLAKRRIPAWLPLRPSWPMLGAL